MIERVYTCRRGHVKPKPGWCSQCGKDRYNAINSDPVAGAAHKARKRREEKARYEASQEYRDRKNSREWVRKNFPSANAVERERMFVDRMATIKEARKQGLPNARPIRNHKGETMIEETKKPFCVRGHARKKKGPCPICIKEWRQRLRQDPERFSEYKARRNDRERKLMPLTKPMKQHAKEVAERLLAKADELVKRERAKSRQNRQF